MQPRRSLSTVERETLQDALGAVELEKKHMQEEGLSQTAFALGVLNLVATTFIFAKMPHSLWLLYGIKCIVLIPAWFYTVIKVYRGALFVLDFCWVANIWFAIYMVLSFANVVPVVWQRSAFLIFFACALGPLGWACVALHNGLVFHNVEKITSLFVHFSPTLVAFTLINNSEEVAKVWPGRFPDAAQLAGVSAQDIYLHGLVVYLIWLLVHGLWLLSIGVNCPKWGYDTVFDNLYKKQNLGKTFSAYTSLQGIRSHAAIYLVIHCVAVNLTLAWAALCFKFVGLHLLFGGVVFLCAVWSGAGYYDYIIAQKYTKTLKKLLDEKSK